MQKYNLEFYYNNEGNQFQFFQLPKILFTDQIFKTLSLEARVMYTAMLDRMALSAKSKGRVYIYFTIEDGCEFTGLGKNKVIKIFTEIDSEKGVGLIHRERQGQGKPTRIYVKSFASNKNTAKDESVKKQEVFQNTENIVEDKHIEVPQYKHQENYDVKLKEETFKTNEELEYEVIEEVNQEQGIPKEYLYNRQKLDISLSHLLDIRNDEIGYEEKYNACNRLFKNALVDMLSSQKTMQLSGDFVQAQDVYNSLRAFIDFETFGIGMIVDLLEFSIGDFEQALEKTTIKNKLAYMKSVVWSRLKNQCVSV